MERIGFIGIGLMGRYMSRHLLEAGHPLTVWNRTAEKAKEILDAGASWADSPSAVSQASDVVITMVTDAAASDTVICGENGVLEGAHVFAYLGRWRPDPPEYLAPATGKDGRFEISLPGRGLYTIGARTGLRGKPRPSDNMGFWGEKDQPRQIEEGTVTEGVRIVVKPYKEITN